MLILARAAIAFIALAARLKGRLSAHTPKRQFEGIPYYENETRHKGRVTAVAYAMPLKSPVHFHLTQEGGLDRFFKALGISQEFQSVDDRFDAAVYVACDHPFFGEQLQRSPAARKAVLDAFGSGVTRIWTDGELLWMSTVSPFTGVRPDLLKSLRQALLPLESGRPEHGEDRFVRRAVFIEGLVWALTAYAAAGFFEGAAFREDYHLDSTALFQAGMLASAALVAGLFALAAALLKGSSRAHRWLVEIGLMLLLSAPIAGLQLVSDLNRGLDREASVDLACSLQRTEIREHRGRRGRRYYTYHFTLNPCDGRGLPLPREIEVSASTYQGSAAGSAVTLRVGRGALGHPWYRSIEAR